MHRPYISILKSIVSIIAGDTQEKALTTGPSYPGDDYHRGSKYKHGNSKKKARNKPLEYHTWNFVRRAAPGYGIFRSRQNPGLMKMAKITNKKELSFLAQRHFGLSKGPEVFY